MKIGFIGFGEAAYYLALGLKEEGLGGIRAADAMQDHPTRGALVRDRAREAGVELLPDNRAVAEWADMVWCVTPAQFARAALESVLDVLRPEQLYVDLSSSTPAAKAALGELAAGTGVRFADGAMLGSLPASRHKVQIIACGPGAEAFKEAMDPWGMKIQLHPGAPGAACAIKLVRSIYMKGLEALLLELLEGAEAYGVTEDVLPTVCATMDKDPFREILDRLVTGMAIHCKRRGDEIRGSVEMLREAGIDPWMCEAAAQRHQALEPYGFADRFAGKKPVWQDVLAVLKEKED